MIKVNFSLLIFLCAYVLFSQTYLPNTIVVKSLDHKNNVFEFKKEFDLKFHKLLGNTKVKNAINLNLIDWTLNKVRTNFRNYSLNPTTSLKRIFIVQYENPIDPVIVSSKLLSTGIFEYVEPLYLHKVELFPNDSLVSYQYYLKIIKAFVSWELLDSDNIDTVIVGIVDTGVDLDHSDLKDNIFYNSGEIGLDSLGKDKRSNGVDDDGNGYIDDFCGWDFAGSNGSSPDNDPKPGNGHGTHVAGIVGAVTNNFIGISGIVPKVKILAVKAASDDIFNPYITHGYEGIFYAASMGAKVINCSWGSQSNSNLENDVIRAVNSLGVCVVAAAGNDNTLTNFTPASYNGVLSVCAVDSMDRKASFSNYSPTVDVSAPGVEILSSVPGNGYTSWNGTSMATPIASGIVALARQKFPYLNVEEIYELVKTQTDNIDSLNQSYVGLIGYGRVNAFKTLSVQPDTIRSIILTNYSVKDGNGDGLIVPKEQIDLYFSFRSIFSDIHNVYVKIPSNIRFIDSILKPIALIGDLKKNEQKNSEEFISFKLSENIPLDYKINIPLEIFDSLGFIRRTYIQLTVNPSFRTMDYNNLKISFNSRGNIGFNDYPMNLQGIGFVYLNLPNILFEGGLLLGFDQRNLYDVVRSSNQNYQNKDLVVDSIFSVEYLSYSNSYVGSTVFHTIPDSLDNIAFSIKEKIFQPVNENDSNIVILLYEVENKTGRNIDSLFIGLFFDWDIGFSGQTDQCFYDYDFGFGYAFNTQNSLLPYVGAKVLGNFKTNFYAIDNDGRSNDSIGIYDGFTKTEKWKMLSGKISRRTSRITDVSFMISSGPFSISKDSIQVVSFALFAGKDLAELRKTSVKCELSAYKLGFVKSLPLPDIQKDYVISLFPNPFGEEINLRVSLINKTPFEVFVYDTGGNLINKFSYLDNIPWTIEQPINLKENASGTYLVKIQFPNEVKTYLVSKVR